MKKQRKQPKGTAIRAALGESGRDLSWQWGFPANTPCVHCEAKARIAITAMESRGALPLIRDLHANDLGSGGDYWVHDAVAFALYLCTKCTKATCLYDQA